MLGRYKDWRYGLMWVAVGIIMPVVLHLLPEPLHIPYSWGFSAGWVTTSLIIWFVALYRNRSQGES